MKAEKIILTKDEIKRFTQWVVENIDETIVPNDEGHCTALQFNLIHAIYGDNERYNYMDYQDCEVGMWLSEEEG